MPKPSKPNTELRRVELDLNKIGASIDYDTQIASFNVPTVNLPFKAIVDLLSDDLERDDAERYVDKMFGIIYRDQLAKYISTAMI